MTTEPVVQYLDLLPDDEPDHWPSRWLIISRLANICQLSELAWKPEGWEWRDKAAVYRQHAVKLARRMGWEIPKLCGYCSKPTNLEAATDHSTHVSLNLCGHLHHFSCQAKARWRGDTTCVTCQQQASDTSPPGICQGLFGHSIC